MYKNETTFLPLLAHQNYQVDVSFRIRQRIEDFALEIRIPDKWGGDIIDGLSIRMKSSDIADVNLLLQDALSKTASLSDQWSNLSEDEQRNQLRYLANVGYSAFNMVFEETKVVEIIRKIFTIANKDMISLEIVSNDFFLPWEILYPIDPDENLSWNHFWGANHLISRKLPTSTFLSSSPYIHVKRRPNLGLLIDDRLAYVVAHEVPFFERLDVDGKISLSILDSLNPQNQKEGFLQFKGFLSKHFEILHFACHASYNHNSVLNSTITLSDGFSIPLHSIKNRIIFGSKPLVILNACETGNLNPQHTNHFAAAFYHCGAIGVIATDCAVSDYFAATFAQQLYTHLLDGIPLGRALLATRRYFLKAYNNPACLLYSMYARPSIQLVIDKDMDN